MSRPNVTDSIVEGLRFARACVLDQQAASHGREDRTWDERYAPALAAIDVIIINHERALKRST
jgi:hypothetical protein